MFDNIKSPDLTQSFQLLLAFTTYLMVSTIRESTIEIFMARYLRIFDTFLCAIPTLRELKVKLNLVSSPAQGRANKRSNKKRKLHGSPSKEGESSSDENFQIPTSSLGRLELAKSRSMLNEMMRTFRQFRHFDYIMAMCISLVVLFSVNQSVDKHFDLHDKMYFTTFDAFFVVLLVECFRLLLGNVLPYFKPENSIRCTYQRDVIYLLVVSCVICINSMFAVMGNELDFRHPLLESPIGQPLWYLVRTLYCALIAACYSVPGIRFGIAQKLLNEEDIPRKIVKTGMVTFLNSVQLIYCIVFASWFIQVRLISQHVFGLTPDQYDTFRLYFTLFAILLRFTLFPIYIMLTMEATFREQISELMKTKPTTNYQTIRMIVIKTNNSLTLALSHFLVPFIVQACLCLALFHRGRLQWNPFRAESLPDKFYPKVRLDNFAADPQLNRAVFGYFIWWGCLVHLVAGIALLPVGNDYLSTRFVET